MTDVPPQGETGYIAKEEPEVGLYHYEGVSIDFLQHFNIEIRDLSPQMKEQLRDTYRMLEGEDSLSKFRSLAKIERRLGKGGQMSLLNKVWNWLKIQKNIERGRDPRYQKAKQQALEAY
jgi:hypothetical protein